MDDDIIELLPSFEEDLRKFGEPFSISSIGFGGPTTKSLVSQSEKLCKFYGSKIPSLSRLLIKFKEANFIYNKEIKNAFKLYPSNPQAVTRVGMEIVKEIRKYLEGYEDDENISQKNSEKSIDPEVFIIHGRRVDLARELYQLLSEHGIKGKMLQNEPNLGNTLIEKFERVLDNSVYAIAIITPDDVGGLKGEPQKDRGRQNVIFELGSFISKNRKRVCILLQGDIELPSDIQGIAYHRFNNEIEEVSRKILKELNAASIKIKF